MSNHNNYRSNLWTYKHLFQCLSKGEPKWRIAIYVRLSKEDIKKGVSESIISQLKWLDFQMEHVLKLEDYIIADIYIDDGRSGTDFDREDYIRMVNDIDKKFANLILIKDISRYARNLAEGIIELDRFVLTRKIRFVCTDIPPFDTLKDPTAISSPEVYQALQDSENHARNTSKKIRQKQFMLRLEGLPTGGFPPYGFMKHSDPEVKHWMIDSEAIDIVVQIFEWSADGVSARMISRKLNILGIPNPTAYKKMKNLKYQNPHAKNNSGLWCPSTVTYILNNKVYLGCMVQGKSASFDHKRHKQIPKPKDEHIVIKDCHDKAINEEVFEKSNEERKNRTRITKSGKPHIFANLVYCSGCKKALKKSSSSNSTGVKYHYLRCRTTKNSGKGFCDDDSSIRSDELAEIVFSVIKSQLELIADLRETVKRINHSIKTENNSTRIQQFYKSAEDEKSRIDRYLDESWYDFKRGLISEEQFLRIKKDNEEKKEKIIVRMKGLLLSQDQLNKGIDYNYQYFQIFLAHKDATVLNRDMLKELVKKIVIYPDQSIDITFNYADQFLLIVNYITENQRNDNDKHTRT